jgi:hypothetical protein
MMTVCRACARARPRNSGAHSHVGIPHVERETALRCARVRQRTRQGRILMEPTHLVRCGARVTPIRVG